MAAVDETGRACVAEGADAPRFAAAAAAAQTEDEFLRACVALDASAVGAAMARMRPGEAARIVQDNTESTKGIGVLDRAVATGNARLAALLLPLYAPGNEDALDYHTAGYYMAAALHAGSTETADVIVRLATTTDGTYASCANCAAILGVLVRACDGTPLLPLEPDAARLSDAVVNWCRPTATALARFFARDASFVMWFANARNDVSSAYGAACACLPFELRIRRFPHFDPRGRATAVLRVTRTF